MARQLQTDGTWKTVSSTKDSVYSQAKQVLNKSSNNSSEGDSESGDTDTKTKSSNTQSYDDYNLEGECSIVPNPKLTAKSCVNIMGVGKYLSGKYYVSSSKFSWTKSGCEHVLKVIKSEFTGTTALNNNPTGTSRREVINLDKD